jgi:hypothetical protein
MASTYSTSLKLELIGNGEQSGVWGSTTNNNLGNLLEQAITGVQTITMANADYTLTNLNGTLDEARNAVLVVQGTNSVICKIIAPAVEKTYVVSNQTTGGYAITIGSTAVGSSIITIPNGVTTQVYCDGTNFYSAYTGAAGDFTVTGNESVGGNLTVTGNESVGGNLAVTGNETIGGDVVIGASVASAKLDVVQGTGIYGITIRANSSNQSGSLRFTDSSLSNEQASVNSVSGGGLAIYTGSTPAQAMLITPSGNVGIGTSSPSAQLQQYAASGSTFRKNTNGSVELVEYASTAVSACAYGTTTNHPLLFTTNNAERFRIGSDGQLGIGGANYGTSGQVLSSNGASSAPSWQDNNKLTSGTAQASTSGTSIDFTSIPSWVKRITVMFNTVSTNGSSYWQIQVGSGSITSTGYNAMASAVKGTTCNSSAFTTGFGLLAGASSYSLSGSLVLTLLSSNIWTATGFFAYPSGVETQLTSGSISLSGALDRVRITTVNGTDAFDAGSINILYE